MKPAELTPEIVRKLCREIGGSTNGQAADVEDACRRILWGEPVDSAIAAIRAENEDGE